MFILSLILIMAISTFAEYYFGMTYRLYLQAEQKTYIISLIQVFTVILSTIAIVSINPFWSKYTSSKTGNSNYFCVEAHTPKYYVKKEI